MVKVNEVHRVAKKYKKFFESYWIDQQVLVYNNKRYYLAFYKVLNKDTGGAFFTPAPGASEREYKEAFEWFTLLLMRLGSIKDVGEERRNINMTGLEKVNEFLKRVDKEVSLSQSEYELV
ncbi:hypothetical protein [Alkalibacillus haloalkaliphilus]|uniref:hypothetical protein n=1 Tax=Alkalibacillus haloalkaliphilus TaxID=94136 RepID=UPI00293636D7|nr:hypothetical protein [Alkalibacillus haloalkaliphilus]MDV2581452.1 hypothetical protein [Alkalibacillus haloalkaliphilus]